MSFSTIAKNLGYHIADGLTINAHVKDTCRKAYIGIGRINVIRQLLCLDTR